MLVEHDRELFDVLTNPTIFGSDNLKQTLSVAMDHGTCFRKQYVHNEWKWRKNPNSSSAELQLWFNSSQI